MRFTYCGKRVKRDDFGHPLKTFPPCAVISYEEKATELLRSVLTKTGYDFDEFGDGNGTCFAQVVVEDREEYEEFVRDFKTLYYRETHAVGDTVFVIVKDMSTFRLKVVKGIIARMTDKGIRITEPEVYRGVAHTEWTFPWSAIHKEVFDTDTAANRTLKNIGGE